MPAWHNNELYIHQDMDTRKESVEKFTSHMLALTEYERDTTVKTA